MTILQGVVPINGTAPGFPAAQGLRFCLLGVCEIETSTFIGMSVAEREALCDEARARIDGERVWEEMNESEPAG